MARATLRDGSATVAVLLLAAALLSPAAGGAQEPPPGSGGALRITAEPARLVLGRDDGAELRVSAPPDVRPSRSPRARGRSRTCGGSPAGGFAARSPPGDHVPRVAIVSAVAHGTRGLEDGWVAVPMSGEGDARVRGAPGTPITLRIGDRTFGPRVAGRDGVAVVPVVVPPGVREAHQGFRPIDLRVPETPLLHAVLERSGVRADREEKVRVVAYVVAPHGAARRGDAPVFEPSRGTVAVSEREAGAYPAIWTLPPGLAGEERLTIRLPAAPASRAVLRVEAVAGPPALVAVSFDRDVLDAGGEPASVTARALDAAGNPVPGELSLEAVNGDLTDVRERRPASSSGGSRRARRCAARRPSSPRARRRSGSPAPARCGSARRAGVNPVRAARGRPRRRRA